MAKARMTNRSETDDLFERMSSVLVSGQPLMAVAQEIVDQMVRSLDARGGILLLHDPETKVLVPCTTSSTRVINAIVKRIGDIEQYVFELDRHDNEVTRCFLQGRPVHGDDFSAFLEGIFPSSQISWFRSLSGTKSSAAMPVTFQSEKLGVAYVNYPNRGDGARSMERLRAFADITAIAINNAMQSERMQAQNRRLEALLRASEEYGEVLEDLAIRHGTESRELSDQLEKARAFKKALKSLKGNI